MRVRGGVEASGTVAGGAGPAAVRQLEQTRAALAGIDPGALERLCAAVARTHEGGGTIFVCGNGGSATTASHFAQDLAKSTLLDPDDADRLRVVALADVSVVTAWANDHGFETVFEQPLRALARPGDLLVALSGSGNSVNVLNAVRWANAHGVETFAATGFDGGTLRRLAGDAVHVDVPDMEIAENAHLAIAHVVVCATREWKRERRGR